jgi:AMIN domain
MLWVIALIACPHIASTQEVPSIRNVQVLRGGNQVEIQIESSAPIIPQTNELGGPNRLLIDFVKAKPGAELRGQEVNRAEVKDLRVALFSKDPPVTRVVVDLNSPQPYQVFPAGRTTIIKIGNPGGEIAGMQASSGNVAAANQAAQAPPEPPKPTLAVSFNKGLLSINSDRSSLSEVLFAVHQRTGAEIAIPAGAEQEKVVVSLGPAPAPEVLSQLLNGSKFNFVILSSPKDPAVLDQVILSPRTDGPVQAQAQAPVPQPAPPTPSDDASNPDDENNPRFRMRGRPGLPPFRDPNPPTDDQPGPPTNEPQ